MTTRTTKEDYYIPNPDKIVQVEETLKKAASIEAQVLKNAKTSHEMSTAIGNWCSETESKFFKFMAVAYSEKDAIEWLALAFMHLRAELTSNQEKEKLVNTPLEQQEQAIKEFCIAQFGEETSTNDSKQTA